MRSSLAIVLLIVLATAPLATAGDAVFQWSVDVPRGSGRTCTAQLWIPPTAERVRGVVIGCGPSLTEISTDPAGRKAAAAEDRAIIAARGFDSKLNNKTGDGPATFQRILDRLGTVSGYGEISVTPFFSFGHSVSCNYATAAACWKPRRCFGVLVFKGGLVLPKYDPQANISGIPILAIKGQFEEFGPGPSGVLRDYEDRDVGWLRSRERYLQLRRENENILISMVVEPGSTHMAWTPRDGAYFALFLRKAAKARIPDWPVAARKPVPCKQIDVKSGALTSAAITNPAAPAAAPYAEWEDSFQSRRNAVYWHVDMELARAWEAFHEGQFNKRPQFVAFTDPKTSKPIYSRHDLRYGAKALFVGSETFKVTGTFLTEYRARDRYPAPAGQIGHARGPIRFRRFGGGIEQVGPDTFRVVTYGRRGGSGAILAHHPGNDEYRHAEQPASVRLPLLTQGKAQKITFPPIGELTAGAGSVKLRATSDSGLAVRYAVQSGPAVVTGDTLRLTKLPPRAKLPTKVVVTAYQWGSAVGPFVQTAAPVTQAVTVEPRTRTD